jgi:predicted Zn-dependent protease
MVDGGWGSNRPRVPGDSIMHRGLFVLVLLGAFALAGQGCTTNPVTGQKVIFGLSRDEELKVGADAAPQFTQQFGGKVNNPRLQAYVTDLGKKLASGTELDFPSLPWEFTLLNSDVINAFALPGGKVFITRGLAAKLDNEAQMAGVLGHEIGHVTARHASQQAAKQMGIEGVLTAVGVAVGVAGEGTKVAQYGQYGVPALQMGGQVLMLKFSRNDETQADELGMRYMTRAGYNPEAQKQVMEVLQRETASAGRQPEILETHPYPEDRIKHIEQLLAKDYANTGQLGFFPERYKSDFLDILAKEPPAPPPPPQDAPAGGAAGKGAQSAPSGSPQQNGKSLHGK